MVGYGKLATIVQNVKHANVVRITKPMCKVRKGCVGGVALNFELAVAINVFAYYMAAIGETAKYCRSDVVTSGDVK